jgi:uncharacterized RDD family membrane protein YckC
VTNELEWAGKRLGLLQSGSGSLAKMGRRIGALVVDWGIAYFLAAAFLGGNQAAMLLIFLVEQWILVATAGGSIGHRIFGMKVVRLDGAWIGFWRSLIRAGLLVLLIPATIWDADNRGLHDKAAGTALLLR